MIFDWFSTKEADEFAKAIVAELTQRIPPDGVDLRQGRKVWEKLLKNQRVIFDKTAQFVHSHRLNIYQKASFGNTFKWALKEAGYSQEFIDTWTHELVAFVSLKSRDSSAKKS